METMNYLTCACCIAVVGSGEPDGDVFCKECHDASCSARAHPEDDDHECFAAALAFEPELPA
jgi:hypothetical protein